MDLLSHLAFGLGIALHPINLGYCFLGVLLGTFVGVLPGIGPLATIAILLPVTYYLPPVAALIMLAGIYYGAMYGGSTTSILLNLPGTAAAAVVCIDGYPMARQGRAGAALVMTTWASFFGSCVAVAAIAAFAPVLAGFALRFGPAEYFSLVAMGLVIAAVVSQGSLLKGLAMVLLGLLLGVVGTDVDTGWLRLTFGIDSLADGISLIVIAMGLFGLAEVINSLARGDHRGGAVIVRWRDLLPSAGDIRASWRAVLRGTGLGAMLGALPGAGPTISSFASYAMEKRLAADRSRFGRGAIEGVAGPEAANNAAAQTSFIPTLTLGIPGDAVMALMMGAMIIHGIAPGPQVMARHPDLFWGVVVSMWVGNLILLLLNLPLIGIWVRLVRIPYRVLFPTILAFVCVGVYSLRNNAFDVLLAAAFGGVGYVLLRLGCEPAPLLLGFILGPMMEENLRRALLLSRGDLRVFLTEPISLAFILIGTGLLVTVLIPLARRAP